MFRLIFMTFHGKPGTRAVAHTHESPGRMTIPLIVPGGPLGDHRPASRPAAGEQPYRPLPGAGVPKRSKGGPPETASGCSTPELDHARGADRHRRHPAGLAVLCKASRPGRRRRAPAPVFSTGRRSTSTESTSFISTVFVNPDRALGRGLWRWVDAHVIDGFPQRLGPVLQRRRHGAEAVPSPARPGMPVQHVFRFSGAAGRHT